jgi:hypothetical protein
MNTHVVVYSGKNTKTNKLNSNLREFIQETDKPYILLHNNDTELPRLSEHELQALCENYEQLYTVTSIPYFAGKVVPQKTLDYGPVKFSFGHITEQKITTEFITRDAILKNGYFDVRFNDNCRIGDYIYRLSNNELYPVQDIDKLPVVFDINQNANESYAKHVFEELSCGWFQYKHKNFPQLKEQESLENVITSIKKFKKQHEH